MTRIGWFMTALLAAVLVALVAWFMGAGEWVEVEVPYPARGEAARDRFYVAKQLTRRLGASAVTVHDLERLPPAGATLVIGSHRWNMFPGREAALRRWLDEGGHLVVLQSAWSAQGDTPRWVPMRSARLARGDAAAQAASAAASAADAAAEADPDPDPDPDTDSDSTAQPQGEAAARIPGRCDDFVEPAWIDPAFGAPRHYRVCGRPTRLLDAGAPTWLLRRNGRDVAARVDYGRGDITVNALEGSFGNGALLRDDGALALAAMLHLQPGDQVWFFDEETRARLLAVLWEHGAPALLLAAAAIALALWRSGVRFGPLLADATRARRSVGEQVRRTAAFIAGGGGAALHRASVRALEEAARRSIAGYAARLGARERAEAIARTTRQDAAALAAAMSPPQGPDRHRLAAAIARLEHARRALLPDRRRSPRRPPSPDPSPP